MSNKPEDKEQPPGKIEIEYQYDPDYRVVAANGIFGGVTPKGELRMDFFVEYNAVPGPGEIAYKAEGDKWAETTIPQSPKLVRRIQVGVLVSPHHIDSFAKWFRDKAQTIKLQTEELKGKKVN